GVRVGSDTTHVPLVATPAPEFAPALSPDGRWLAYSKEVNGRDEVFVRPFPYTKSGSMWQVTAHGLLPEWSHDGSELFYLSLGVDNEMMAVSVTTSPTFAVGAPEPLFDVGAYRTCCFGHLYAVTPDDRHFMMLTYPAGRTTPDARVVEVENWLPEIQAKLKGR
ncbi:MAG: hypothetical protein LJF06_09385, partial [Gemmatimonadetes bacterium]|nr:hypothetical protein [Gemmatimonadota bacterium]